MKARPAARMIVYALVFFMPLPVGAMAQSPAGAGGAPRYSRQELAQMLAPVALYPDSLLAQMLMASTYPLEVVQAARWVAGHPDLKGNRLDAALRDQGWDVSVKAMAHFPDVLAQMDARIEETARLGDAFLAQEGEVMDTIQELRARARAEGHLVDTREQKVVVRETVIVIEPADPGVIYVPAYNPVVVYGPWWYPAYPPYRPYFAYYPAYYPGAFAVSFTGGSFVGAAVGSWCRFGWHYGRVDVDVHRTANFNRNVHAHHGGHRAWSHDPHHRKGVHSRDRHAGRHQDPARLRSGDARRPDTGFERSPPAAAEGGDLSAPVRPERRGRRAADGGGNLQVATRPERRPRADAGGGFLPPARQERRERGAGGGDLSAPVRPERRERRAADGGGNVSAPAGFERRAATAAGRGAAGGREWRAQGGANGPGASHRPQQRGPSSRSGGGGQRWQR